MPTIPKHHIHGWMSMAHTRGTDADRWRVVHRCDIDGSLLSMIANLYEQTFAVTTPPTFNSTTPPLTRLRSATSPAKDVHTFIVRHFRLQTSATNVMERAWQSIVLICCWICVFARTVFHSHTLVLGLIVSAWTSRIDVSHLKQHEATMMDITWDTLCRTSTGSNCS